MNHHKTLALLLFLYLIWLVPQRSSAASLVETLRHLAQEGLNSKHKPIQETSPSPSPDPEADNKSKSGDAKVDTYSAVAEETCETVSDKCFDEIMDVTACVLPYSGHGPKVLLVLNGGDSSLKLNVTVIPLNSTYSITEIPGHQVRKINVSSSVGGSSSIVVTAVNWTCTIPTGVHIEKAFPSYIEYVTPINGVYLFLATALLIGGTWACCKLGKNRRHLDGVPYQELEMEQQQSLSSIDVQSAEGWDQSWDDDWDEEKAVKSPGGNYRGKRRANGIGSS